MARSSTARDDDRVDAAGIEVSLRAGKITLGTDDLPIVAADRASTVGDLKLSVSQVEDKHTKDRLQAILETLNPAVA
jgi:hypothetical protein